jgi:hypothetical protein
MSDTLASCQHILRGHHDKVDKDPITRVAFRPVILSAGGTMETKTAEVLIRWKRVLAPSMGQDDGQHGGEADRTARIEYGRRFGGFCIKICPLLLAFYLPGLESNHSDAPTLSREIYAAAVQWRAYCMVPVPMVICLSLTIDTSLRAA